MDTAFAKPVFRNILGRPATLFLDRGVDAFVVRALSGNNRMQVAWVECYRAVRLISHRSMVRGVLVEEAVLRRANRRLCESTIRGDASSSSLRFSRSYICLPSCKLGEVVLVIAQVRSFLIDIKPRQIQ